MNKNTWRMLREEPKAFIIEGLKHKGLYGPPGRLLQYWARRITQSYETVETIQGSLMQLDLRDMGASTELFLRGIREDKATKVMQEWLRPGMTVLEAGSHIGYYVLMESKAGCDVIAVEPDPSNYERLCKNIQLNQYTRIETINAAVGSSPGVLRFDNRGVSNWRRVSVDGQGIEVPVRTIDSLQFARRIDLIRMDVEGFEFNILLGAKNAINKSHPKFFIEVHRDLIPNYGFTQDQLFALLAEYGYKVTHCFIGGKDGPIGPAHGYTYPGTSAHVFLE